MLRRCHLDKPIHISLPGGDGVFADTHGTTITYRDERQSVCQRPQFRCLTVVCLQTRMALSSLTATSSSQLTDICAITSDLIEIVALYSNQAWLSPAWLLSHAWLLSQLFTLFHGMALAPPLTWQWFSCGFFLVHPFRSRFYLSHLLRAIAHA
jgi:hypothetical protein